MTNREAIDKHRISITPSNLSHTHKGLFTIIGEGAIGDKAKELIIKNNILGELGFHIPKTIVLSEEYLSNILHTKQFNHQQIAILEQISQLFSNRPLVIRSSGEGDARGTGIYKTVFSPNNIESIKQGIVEVLESYNSESAKLFRTDAQIGDGFGIMIQPIIGDTRNKELYPLLSGFGYTSTPREGSYINIVPGLGGGVDSRNGEKINYNNITHKFDLEQYLQSIADRQRSSMIYNKSLSPQSSLLNIISNLDRYDNPGSYYSLSGQNIYNKRFSFEDIFLSKINITPLFRRLHALEYKLQKPQYIERALTSGNSYRITQVSDVNKKLDIMDFSDLHHPILAAHTVTGSGSIQTQDIAYCWNPGDEKELYEFNKSHKDYILIFPSRLVTGGLGRKYLHYHHFSNAKVFLEIQDANHVGDPISHLGGQLEMAGKIFGVIDYGSHIKPQREFLNKHKKNYLDSDFSTYQGSFTVIASEKQDQLIVDVMDINSHSLDSDPNHTHLADD